MLSTFTVTGQKVTHDLGSRTLVAGSSGEVQASFDFDDSWEGYDAIIVFTNSNQQCGSVQPIKYEGEAFYIPDKALKAGKLFVSVIGFAGEGKRKTTLKWDIQQAITVQECGAMGNCDLLRSMAQSSTGEVSDKDVASDEEVNKMLEEVFGGEVQLPDNPEPTVSEEDIASDEDVSAMLDEVFGNQSQHGGGLSAVK